MNDTVSKGYGSNVKHKKIQDDLETRLKNYGYKVYTNINYYNDDTHRVIGEIDVLAIKTDKQGYMRDVRLYEVKSGSDGYSHAQKQLKRARNYFSPNKQGVIPKLVYVTADRHGAMKARRVR